MHEQGCEFSLGDLTQDVSALPSLAQVDHFENEKRDQGLSTRSAPHSEGFDGFGRVGTLVKGTGTARIGPVSTGGAAAATARGWV